MSIPRSAAALIAVAVFATIALRLWLNMQEGNSLPSAIWTIYRFFTVWTITAIGVISALISLGRPVSSSIQGALLLAIVAVALVFHILLASRVSFEGLEILVNQMFHTIIPISWVLYWVFLSPKKDLRLGMVPSWLVYPLVYCLYAMTRGAFDGTYPYFFLDIGNLGIGGVAAYCAGLLLVFAIAGAGIVGLARIISSRH